MLEKKIVLLALSSLLLSGCINNTPSSSSVIPSVTDSSSEVSSTTEQLEELEIHNVSINGVMNGDKNVSIVNPIEGETYSYSFDGDAISITSDGVISAYRGGTSTEVRVTSSLGRTSSFVVTVLNRTYSSTHKSAEESEGWFNEVSVSKVNSMTSSFANGMDISSFKQLYDNGAKFYNKEGKETFH